MAPSREEIAIAILADHRPRSGAAPAAGRGRLPITDLRPWERWGFAVLLLWLLVGPRIELIAGLRVEDLVFAAMAFVCLLHVRIVRRPSAPSLAMGGVALAGVISAATAAARGMVDLVPAVLYAVRPLEYWIVFPAVLLLIRSARGIWTRRVETLLVVVTVLQTAFAIMQYYFGLQVGFSHAAYTRAAGLTVGPYELGAISAILVVYWTSRGRFALASLAVIALAASISRISILGAAVAIGVLVAGWLVGLVRRARIDGLSGALRRYRRPPLVRAGQIASVLAASLVLAFTVGLIQLPEEHTQQPAAEASSSAPVDEPSAEPSDEPADEPTETSAPSAAVPEGPQAPSDSIARRLASTSVLGSWNAAQTIAAQVPHSRNAAEYQFSAYSGMNIYLNINTAADAGAEASNLVRFYRWHLILDTFDDPVDVVLGLGPSFVGPSVDGSYLRFFADGGLLGVAAWLVLIVMWLRRSPFWMICVTVSLLVGALFIDIVYAERPMVLYWMLLAVALAPRGRSATEAPPVLERASTAAGH